MAGNLTHAIKIRLDADTREALDVCALADDADASLIARRAIRDYLRRRGMLASPAGATVHPLDRTEAHS